MSNYGLD